MNRTLRELEMRVARLERQSSSISVGDSVMLKPNALQQHSRSTPAGGGYTRHMREYRKTLSTLQGQELNVRRVLSNEVVVDTPVGAVGIPSDLVEKVEMSRTASADVDLARDLAITIPNDGTFYRQLKMMLNGIAKHMAAGRYDQSSAEKQALNIVNAYLPTYKKNSGAPWMRVDKATKMMAAKELLEDQMYYIEEMAEEIQEAKALKRRAFYM